MLPHKKRLDIRDIKPLKGVNNYLKFLIYN